MCDRVCRATEQLRAFLHKEVYNHPASVVEFEKAKDVLKQLYDYYLTHIDKVPAHARSQKPANDNQIVCDYLAGMTDGYAISRYEEIFLPHPWARGDNRDVFA